MPFARNPHPSTRRTPLRWLRAAAAIALLCSGIALAPTAARAASSSDPIPRPYPRDCDLGVLRSYGQCPADAPATVHVYSRDDLRELGLRTIHDVMRITPGFTMVTDINDLVVGSRGIVTDNNSKYVILMNGHNLTSFFNLGINPNHVPPMTLDNVRRVEIITGPGSVLWGSGALLGVINIVTEDAESFVGTEESATEVRVGVGNRETLTGSVQHGRVGTLEDEPFGLYASGKYYQSNGTELGVEHFVGGFAPSDMEPYPAPSDRFEAGPSYEVYGNGTWGTRYDGGEWGLTLRALDTPDVDQGNFPDNTVRLVSDFAELAYAVNPLGELGLRAAVYGDYWRQKSHDRLRSEVLDFVEWRVGGSLEADWHPHPDHRTVAALHAKQTYFRDLSEVDTRTGRRTEEFEPFEVSIQAQHAWDLTDWLGLSAALRYTASDDFDDSLDPKLAAWVRPLSDDHVILKYVFQTAFLHPSAFQRNALIRPRPEFTDADLDRLEAAQREIDNEELTSHEIELRWNATATAGTLVRWFHTDLEDLISFNATDVPPTRTFVNFGDVRTWGLEWEGWWAWGPLRQELSVSYAEAEFEKGAFGSVAQADRDGDLLSYPDVLANIITRYRVSESISMAATVRVLGPADYFATPADRREVDVTRSDTAALLDVHVQVDDAGVDGLDLGFTVFNLLDDATRRPLAANEGSATPEALTALVTADYRF